MIHGNRVSIFQCVTVTVNNGNGKEEALDEKEKCVEISE